MHSSLTPTKSRRATHTGECQSCGHVQMLPSGKLSIHGYQVKWNCFVGTCPGSQELPFEQDKALAERQLGWAEKQMMAAISNAVELETCDTRDTRAWVVERDRKNIYSKNMDVVRVLELLPDEVRTNSGYHTRVGYMDDEGKVRGVYSHHVKARYDAEHHLLWDELTLQAYVREMNNGYSKCSPRFRAEQLNDYIRWMTARLKGWAPKPLKERKDGQ